MEYLGLYEPEELSLFGGEQLLMGLGSPMEPDLLPTFPDVHEKGLGELLGTELPPSKVVNITSDQYPATIQKQDDASCLDLSWLDTKFDLYDLIGELSPQDPPIFTPDAPMLSGPVLSDGCQEEPLITTESLFSQISQGTPGITAESLFSQISQGTPRTSTEVTFNENDLLAEVMSKLSREVIQIAESDSFEITDLTEGVLSPVYVNDIESLLSGPVSPADVTPMDSELDSLFSSTTVSPVSSPSQLQPMTDHYDDPDFEPESGPIRSKSRRSSKPYSKKMPVDRKERKKGQNKTAALKYRMKKKIESESCHDECEQLETKNKDLRVKVDSMTREIQYLKDLMAEVLKAKGIKI